MLIRHPEADARMAHSQGLADYWPWLLRYPITGHCLPVIVMLALLITLAMGNSLDLPNGRSMPTTGLPLMAISVIWVVFYGMRVIDHTTRGYATPPPMGSEALYLFGAMKPLALPAMTALSVFALRPQHHGLANVVLAVSLFVMPAYLFILATQQQLASALNPWRWLKLIWVMRAGYWLPCLLLVVGALCLQRLSSGISLALLAACCCYGLFGTAHLLGYLGFKRQHELGLQVDVRDPDEVEREEAHQAQLKALLKKLHDWQLVRDDISALRAVQSHGGGPLDGIRFYEELFQALSTQSSPPLIHAAGQRLISLLLAARKPERALDIAEGCLNSHWYFAPANPAELEALLRQAIAHRFEDLFDRLLKGAEVDQHLTEPAWAKVQFLRAQHQAEARRDDVGALQLLQPLRAMTQHAQHALFERTARTLEALLARQKT